MRDLKGRTAIGLGAALWMTLCEYTVVSLSCAHIVITRSDWLVVLWVSCFWTALLCCPLAILSAHLARLARLALPKRMVCTGLGAVPLTWVLFGQLTRLAFVKRSLQHAKTEAIAVIAWVLAVIALWALSEAIQWFDTLAGANRGAGVRGAGLRRVYVKRIWTVRALWMGALGAAFLSRFWLPRLFPLLHWVLALFAAFASIIALRILAKVLSGDGGWSSQRMGNLGLGCVFAALVTSWLVLPHRLARAPDAVLAIDQCTPVTAWMWQPMMNALGQVQSKQLQARASMTVQTGHVERPVPAPHGAVLAKHNILLITVDALRADSVEPKTMPCLSRFAQQGVVFSHAYSPTPHTSYALTSLHASKYLRSLMSLKNHRQSDIMWAQVMRRYGYRTAAFYPPAIFFVDHERFLVFERDGLGFEYRKAQFSKAPQRVQELEIYLQGMTHAHPLFVWVHLFEPHEPYDPPESVVRALFAKPLSRASPRQRYDAEVRVVDDTICQLVDRYQRFDDDFSLIVTADHGEEFGDHGGYYHGTTLYDEQVRVPWIWFVSKSSPFKPRVIPCPVETIDIATSVLGALGIPKETRMRGDDVSRVMINPRDCSALPYAFSEIADTRMATNGQDKVICHFASGRCEHYRINHDPRERHDLGLSDMGLVSNFRRAIGQWIASVPNVEAVPLSDTHWPEVLTRARLGDPTSGPALVELISSDAPEAVVIEGLYALGRMHYAPGLEAVSRRMDAEGALSQSPEVRVAAGIAYLQISHVGGPSQRLAEAQRWARSALGSPEHTARLLDASLALLKHGDKSGLSMILDRVRWQPRPDGNTPDTSHDDAGIVKTSSALAEEDHTAALDTLAKASKHFTEEERARVLSVLVQLLKDVRLRIAAANALADLGDKRAIAPLMRALSTEPYLAAKNAEVRALKALRQ